MAESAAAVLHERRIDTHNSSIDGVLAAAGYCGMTHLATGRVCLRPARHAGSCHFLRRDLALETLTVDLPALGGRP